MAETFILLCVRFEIASLKQRRLFTVFLGRHIAILLVLTRGPLAAAARWPQAGLVVHTGGGDVSILLRL